MKTVAVIILVLMAAYIAADLTVYALVPPGVVNALGNAAKDPKVLYPAIGAAAVSGLVAWWCVTRSK